MQAGKTTVAYPDASYASDKDAKKSASGRPVTYGGQLHSSVHVPSAVSQANIIEAEYIAPD